MFDIGLSKWKPLFFILQDINLLFKTIDLDRLATRKNQKYELEDYQSWSDRIDIIAILESMRDEDQTFLEDALNSLSLSNQKVIDLIRDYQRILFLLIKIDATLLGRYGPTIEFLSRTLNEFQLHTTINYNVSLFETRNIPVSNTWYITTIGDLYNSGGMTNSTHKETNLIYAYERVQHWIENQNSFMGMSKKLLEEKKNILEIIKSNNIKQKN